MSDPAPPPAPAPAVRKPGYTSYQTQLLAVTICCTAIPTFIIGLRVLTRSLVKIPLWWDDYCVFLALLFCHGANISVIVTVNPGLGRHMNEVTPNQGRFIMQALFAHQLFWTVGFGFLYLSILFLYIRLFANTWLRKTSYVLQVIGTVWTVLTLLILFFQCTPLSMFWDPLATGHCIDKRAFYASLVIITMLLYTALFVLPAPVLWKLRLSKTRRCGLIVLFLLGAFVCVTSVVRVVQVLNPPVEDFFWTITPSVVWSCLELNIALLSACIPSLYPLFKILTSKFMLTLSNNRSGYDSRPERDPSKNNRFSHMAYDADEIPLQGSAPESSSHIAVGDNIVLVNPKRGPNQIMVTNQIVQSHDLKPHSLSSFTAGKDPSASASASAYS